MPGHAGKSDAQMIFGRPQTAGVLGWNYVEMVGAKPPSTNQAFRRFPTDPISRHHHHRGW